MYENFEFNRLWENLVGSDMFTEAELSLVTSIMGSTLETLNTALQARYGYRDWEQYAGSELGEGEE